MACQQTLQQWEVAPYLRQRRAQAARLRPHQKVPLSALQQPQWAPAFPRASQQQAPVLVLVLVLVLVPLSVEMQHRRTGESRHWWDLTKPKPKTPKKKKIPQKQQQPSDSPAGWASAGAGAGACAAAVGFTAAFGAAAGFSQGLGLRAESGKSLSETPASAPYAPAQLKQTIRPCAQPFGNIAQRTHV